MPPSSVPLGAIHLLKQLLTSQPDKRISLSGVLSHYWIVNVTEVRELKKMCADVILKNSARYDLSELPKELLSELRDHRDLTI